MSFKSSGPKTRPDRVKPVPGPSPTRSRSSSVSSTTSFTSAVEDQNGEEQHQHTISKPVRFSKEEETQMVDASHKLKTAANKQFAAKDFSSAISTYDKALAELPIYLDYELAVLQSNIAACHLQLQEWKEAIDSAEKGLDGLERELPMPKAKQEKKKEKQAGETENAPSATDAEESKVVELPDENDDEANAEMLKKLDISDQRKADILRIRTKLLLRRARAKVKITEQSGSPAAASSDSAFELDGENERGGAKASKPDAFSAGSTWGNLSAALSDYQTLAQPEYFHSLPQSDQKTVIEMVRVLPKRVEDAKQKEVGEMMGKLKELGNGILKPFGLSTDMFKMVQDPNSGGWSMNFDGKAGK